MSALASDRAASLDARHRAEGVILRSIRTEVARAIDRIRDPRKQREALRMLSGQLTRAWPRGELADSAARLQGAIDAVLMRRMALADLQREVR